MEAQWLDSVYLESKKHSHLLSESFPSLSPESRFSNVAVPSQPSPSRLVSACCISSGFCSEDFKLEPLRFHFTVETWDQTGSWATAGSTTQSWLVPRLGL